MAALRCRSLGQAARCGQSWRPRVKLATACAVGCAQAPRVGQFWHVGRLAGPPSDGKSGCAVAAVLSARFSVAAGAEPGEAPEAAGRRRRGVAGRRSAWPWQGPSAKAAEETQVPRRGGQVRVWDVRGEGWISLWKEVARGSPRDPRGFRCCSAWARVIWHGSGARRESLFTALR